MKTTLEAKLIRVYLGENDRHQERPLYEEILDRSRAAGAVYATVQRGVEGFGGSTLLHRPGLFGRSSDAPIVVTVVAGAEAAERLLPRLEEIVREGLIATDGAEAILYQGKAAAC